MLTSALRAEPLIDRLVKSWARHVLVEDSAAGLTPDADLVLRTVLRVALVLVVLQSVLHLVDAEVFSLRIQRLDADNDISVWGWTGPVAESTAGLGLALLALVCERRRKVLLLASAAAFYFSMDDAIKVHELVGHRMSQVLTHIGSFHGSGRLMWPIVFFPLFAVVFILLWRISGAFVPRCRHVLRLGLLALVFAVGCEVFSFLLVNAGYGRPHLVYELEVVLEEAGELGGWLCIAAALLASGVDVLGRGRQAPAYTAPPRTREAEQDRPLPA